MTADSAATAKHMVHALNADTGAELSGWPVDLNAKASSGSTTFSSVVQNQRAALAMVGGKLFVPFGGHVGDCQGYHGWIVGITTGASPAVSAWVTRAIAGGIWGSSGIASDGTSLYFATGNSKSSASAGPNTSSGDSNPDNWGDAETVFKFPTSLTSPAPATTTDFFLPSNWVALDDADADMGGTSPILVTVPGATPSNLVVALGKDDNAYLLNRANLGGMDATPLAKTKVANGGPIIQALGRLHDVEGDVRGLQRRRIELPRWLGGTDCAQDQRGESAHDLDGLVWRSGKCVHTRGQPAGQRWLEHRCLGRWGTTTSSTRRTVTRGRRCFRGLNGDVGGHSRSRRRSSPTAGCLSPRTARSTRSSRTERTTSGAGPPPVPRGARRP